MLIFYAVYALLGKFVIFFFQKFILDNLSEKTITQNGFFVRLIGCDLCLGFWVYTLLAMVVNGHHFLTIFALQPNQIVVNILDDYMYVPIISEVLTGMVFSFMMHIFRLGWNSKFQVLEVK